MIEVYANKKTENNAVQWWEKHNTYLKVVFDIEMKLMANVEIIIPKTFILYC